MLKHILVRKVTLKVEIITATFWGFDTLLPLRDEGAKFLSF